MAQASTAAQEDYLEDQVGLKDYEVDRITARSKVYFGGRDGNADVEHAKKGMNRILIGFSIICDLFLIGIGYLLSNALAFIFFAIILQLMVIYWRLVLSPLRFHTFASDQQYLQYRGYLTQAQQLKAHWQDGKYKFFVFLYWAMDAIVFCCIIDGPNQLAYLNNVIYDRGKFPLSTVTSLVPALVVIGIIVNIIGAVVYSKYKKIDRARGIEVEDPKMQQTLLGVIIGSIFALFLIGIMNATAFTVFWQPAPGITNPIYLFNMEQPLFAARWNIFWYYGFVVGGSAFLGMLILMGFNGMENAFLHVRLNRAWQESTPVEKNWEFKGVAARQTSDLVKKNQASKRSLREIILVCIILLVAFWVFLNGAKDVNGDIVFENPMAIIGIVLIAFPLLNILFFSHRRHVKRDGRYFYPPPTKNPRYAAFDERGLGQWKYYYREVLPKKKGLLRSATYWALIIAAIFNFKDIGLSFVNWKSLFEGSTNPSGLLIDLGDAVGVSGDYILVAIIVAVTVLTLVTFIGALGKTSKNFNGSVFWSYFYKILLGLMLVLCFFWATKLPGIVMAMNLLSVDFAIALGLIIAYFLLISVLSRYFLFPLLFKFENLAICRNKVLEIVILQAVLMSVLNLIFQWLLPMTGVTGPLSYGYPWRTGVNQEAQYLMENFDLGVFLMEWGGRYIIWGAVQQWLVMGYFLELWRKAFPNSKGYVISIGTALIFGVIHAIDWPLIMFTFIAGTIWAWNWNKSYYDKETGRVHRGNNLFLWGFVHGMGGSLLGILMPFGAAVGPFNMA